MKTTIMVTLTLGLVIAISGSAVAAPLAPNATFGFVPIGSTAYLPAGGDLFGATSVAIPTTETVNAVNCLYLGTQNDFANNPCAGPTPVPLGTAVTFNNFTLDLTFAALPTLTWASGGDNLTFTATMGTKVDTTNTNSEDVLVYYSGTFSDSTGVYIPATPASVTIAFEQDGGPTGQVNFSGSFADPPAPLPGVPEPATMGLFGSALVGLGFIRRRKA